MRRSPLPRLMMSLALAGMVVGAPAQTKWPVVQSKSAVVMDAISGRVLWQKDMNTPRYPASTTKVMTGLLLIENVRPETKIAAPKEVETVGGSSLNLKPGETMTAHDLLYAIMLRSANDACVAAAVHIAGSVPAFVQMMNQRAKQIGCTATTFNNPNGLNDPLHKTTAHDLALMAREAMRSREFQEVVRTQRKWITRSMNDKDILMVNRNKWLRKDDTADGIKTGWTVPSGHCYVGSATREGFRVITVVLNSENWQEDHRTLLDWAYKNFDRKVVARPDQRAARFAVVGGVEESVGAMPKRAIRVLVSPDRQITPTFERKELRAPLRKGDLVGVMKFPDGQSVDLLAETDVEAKPIVMMAGNNPVSFLVIGAGIAAFAYSMRRKARSWTRG